MAKDTVCGMIVDEKTALCSQIGGRRFYFCSNNCFNTFNNPEKELSRMKKRIYVDISGALALAILRAAASWPWAAAHQRLARFSFMVLLKHMI